MCRANNVICAAVSWALFFLLHIANGMVSAVTAGMVGGGFLALTYGLWRRLSLGLAFGMTFICHALLNAVVLVVFAFITR